MEDNTIKWFKNLSGLEEKSVGRKATRIAQINKARIAVPRGFVITNKEFFNFLQKNNLKTKIIEIIKSINFSDPLDIKNKTDLIKHKILRGKISDEFKKNLAKAYSKIGEKKIGWLNTKNNVYTAIRSSVVCEDACALDVKKIEDEGGNLNVKGLDLLIVNIKECWASLFSKNVLILAKEKQINLNKFSIAVIIQEMIDAKTSGILKTSIDENNPKICSIEAIFGLGGRLVLENTNPDYYQTNKTFFEVTQEINNIQKWKLVRNKGKTVKEEIPIKDQKNKKLDKLALKDLTNVAKKVEAYFGTPQVIEWVINKKDIFVLNSEPVDYDLEENKHNKNDLQQRISGFKNKFIVKGVPASKGIAKGTIKIIKNKEDYKKIDEDSIILTDMTNTSMLDIIKKSKAVITKGGSAICNAAVISQKLAKPCVVNIQNLDLFKENQRVQVNGTNGEIYSVQGVEIKNNNFNKKSNNFKNAKKEINNIRKNLFSNNNLDIRNIEKIDLNNIKNVEFPINYLFTEKEILELKNKSTKEIISEIRTKIEKIISKI